MLEFLLLALYSSEASGQNISILPRASDEYMAQFTWPYRLTVRTLAFHAGNRGSIPRRVTQI